MKLPTAVRTKTITAAIRIDSNPDIDAPMFQAKPDCLSHLPNYRAIFSPPVAGNRCVEVLDKLINFRPSVRA
jgi:hypothetical protein